MRVVNVSDLITSPNPHFWVFVPRHPNKKVNNSPLDYAQLVVPH